ncbi:HpnM family protein [Candidatus Methylocalor cossyra]|uniref:Phospholipid transport system substrate-binding protein n=1 Tax=Candidatus Methylocalor cossyra TaxID=3108543 RepID=A0ABM9NFG7_9GAMM
MIWKLMLGLWLSFLAFAPALSDTLEEARKPVDKLNDTLIAVMKGAKQLGYQGRYKKLEPVVKEAFEFEAVSQIALGSHWKKLDKAQKTAFLQKFIDLSIATYAAQFNDYAGESFKFDSSQELSNGRQLLRYQLVAPKAKPVKFEYIVSEFNGRWEIINVIVDGISDLALKKAQYTSVIDREGFDSLLNKLSQKIADYATSGGGTPG